MAITISSQSQLLDNQILIDSAVTADAQNNVRLSEAVSYLFKIDNLNVASSAAYFKIWDHVIVGKIIGINNIISKIISDA